MILEFLAWCLWASGIVVLCIVAIAWWVWFEPRMTTIDWMLTLALFTLVVSFAIRGMQP